MPKKTALVTLVLLSSLSCFCQEKRKPRWPLSKASRALNSSSLVRISQYQDYLQSLTDSELKEFAEDAQINLGNSGINPERIIVKFKNAETEQAVLDSLSFKKPVFNLRSTSTKVLKIPGGANNIQVLAHLGALKELDGVEYAHPDYKIKIADIPNDAHFGRQWPLENTGATTAAGKGLIDSDIDAPEAWTVSKGSRDVIVGILDTGMDYNHPDLVDNVWKNPGETGTDSSGQDKSTNGVDDDGNGFVDDFRGWDFVNNDNDPMDEHGHGTHTAGTVGALGNNGIGVAGINWQVSLVPLQIFDSSGSGDLSWAMAALDYSTQMKFPITNNSWGGSQYSPSFEDLLKVNRDRGCLFVAAAGNNGSNNDVEPFYPASLNVENVISVAASDNKDRLAGFSNYGKNSVHLAAPGVDVISTFPNGEYYYESGTSMAAPHVAGAAALVLSVWPNIGYAAIKNKIIESVDLLVNPSFDGKTKTGGRLNLARAVGGVPSPLPMRLSLRSSLPKVGTTAGGTKLTLSGTGFYSETRVTVGKKPCTSIQIVSQMELNCITSSSAIASLHNITATNPDGSTVTLSGAFRYSSPPVVTSLNPSAGALAGGARITVNGSQFAAGTKVKIGDKDCLQVRLNSANQLSCLVPASEAGSFKTTVINQYAQESSEPIQFTYRPAPEVSTISPLRGVTTGGATLSLTGTGFVSGAVIKVGAQTCNSPRWISQNQITCTSPALTSGVHPVTVTNPEGQNSSSAVNYEAVAPRWIQTNGTSCLTVCSQQNFISKPSPEGAYCTSGEVIPGSARGVISFSNGCKPNRQCAAQGPVRGAVNIAQYCYGPGQARNKEKTDITMGCYCSL